MDLISTAPDAPATVAYPGPAWRTGNLGALLFRAADRCVRTKLRTLHAAGYPTVSEAQLTLFHHLRPGGMRLTALAAEANLTKQSMIELVDRASAMGLVERRPDPDDRRAKAVHLTRDAGDFLASLRNGVTDAEREVQQVFGTPFLLEVRTRLDAYAARRAAPALRDFGADDGWRLHNVGRLFAMTARRFSREALTVAQDRGWQCVNEVLMALLRNLAPEGSRLTDLAAVARVTKQSMRELVDRAEGLDLVCREPDSADGRAKVIVFTSRGRAMLEDVREGVAIAEHGFEQQTDARFMASLKIRLHDLVDAPEPGASAAPAQPRSAD